MSYRKYGVCKGARRAHHKREKARRRKLREKGGQVDPFGFADMRGRDRRALRQMSVSKGTRDGAPKLVAPKDGQTMTKIGYGQHIRDSDGTATAAANEDLPVPQDCPSAG